MSDEMFSRKDLNQIKERGISREKIVEQIEIFKRGFPYSKLRRPCIIGDGITTLDDDDLQRLEMVYRLSAAEGRCMKFVPASGAASRMFKQLLSLNSKYDEIAKIIHSPEKTVDTDITPFLKFISEIKNFAFYDDLKSILSQKGLNIDDLIDKKQYKPVLEYLLTSKGLGLSGLPKGLIKFHQYPDYSRTPFEEHLVEALSYTRDSDGLARLHFTVAPEHRSSIEKHLEMAMALYENSSVKFRISFSVQKESTDTVAVDMENTPFRDGSGRLLFRPGGHGALLENLNDIKGDIIFIKNIDNVVPDRLKETTYIYKKALGGYLVELQAKIFRYLNLLANGNLDEKSLDEISAFMRNELSISSVEDSAHTSREDKIRFLFSKLNRPLRVCGMVRNVGEPGGGPFWIEQTDKNISLQIVESSQVDHDSSEQRAVWESSTHFNPVDLVCGVRDYRGKPFDLTKFVDPDTGFISKKSKEGKELKALELPGLWNGAMSYWNTIFVEVPAITFNPVKTVSDLLRKEHQPE